MGPRACRVVGHAHTAMLAGLDWGGDLDQLTNELIGAVIEAVSPGRHDADGHTWDLLRANHQIAELVGKDLTVIEVGHLLARGGMAVRQRTLHRYGTHCTGHAHGADAIYALSPMFSDPCPGHPESRRRSPAHRMR